MSKSINLFTVFVVLFCLFPLSSNADTVKGRVVNAETGEVLPMAVVKYVIERNGSMFDGYVNVDSLGCFVFQSPEEGRLLMTFSMIGFKNNHKVSYVYGKYSDEVLDMGNVKLQPTALMLQEVSVTAKLPRMTMSGDTIVFNPSAFKLQDGDRLEELIRKLPGVHRENGKLMWNNKPLRLMMNGRDVFSGDNIIEQLPAEVAGKIKMYDRKSELARRTGKNDGMEDHVLDIQVKPGFLDKWYGDARASYVTDKHYVAKLQSFKLSDKSPQMFFFKMNDVNEKMERQDGRTINSAVDKFGKDIFGSYNYQYNWKTKDVQDDNHFDVSASFGHADGWGNTNNTTESFLPNTDRTTSVSLSSNTSHSLKPQIEAKLFAYTDSKNSVIMKIRGTYEKQRITNQNDAAKYLYDPLHPNAMPVADLMGAMPGTELYDRLVSRSRYYTSSERMARNLDANYEWTRFLSKGAQFKLTGNTHIDGVDNESHINRKLEFPRESLSEGLWQFDDSPERNLKTSLMAGYNCWIGGKLYVDLSEKFEYLRQNNRRGFYIANSESQLDNGVPTLLDADNSKDYLLHQWRNTVSFQAMVPFSNKLSLTSIVNWYLTRQKGDLKYGKLDTTAVRTYHMIWPSLQLQWHPSRARNLELVFSHNTFAPELYDRLGWRDSSDPMSIVRGSENLRTSYYYSMYANYTRLWLRQQTMLNVKLQYTKDIHPWTTLLRYDSKTGIYEATKMNCNNGHSINAVIDLNQGIGFYMRANNSAAVEWKKSYGYMTLVDGDNSLRLNRQNRFAFTDRFELSYDAAKLRIMLFNNLTVARYRYTETAYNGTLLDDEYGVDMRLKLSPVYFSLRLWDQFRSGYKSDEMNRHRVMSEASITYKFCKNKCGLSLSVDDIFNQGRSFSTIYDTYQRSETWYETFHHYVSLSFTYQFDAKSKK